MVNPSESYCADSSLNAITAERCTTMLGVPTMYIGCLEHPDFQSFDVSSLRTGCIGGAPCPIELMNRIVHEMNLTDITIGFGMTETGPVTFQTHIDDPLERRVSTVGRVHPHVEMKIINQNGATVPIGVSGEILIRGYCVMHSYWQDSALSHEAINETGWMHTGDLGFLDEQGYLKINGRVKDMVIRGGENIFPREIEDFLYTHPAIETVAVFGLPDRIYGEEICAWIRLRDGHSVTEDDIRIFCKDQIAHFKIPRYIEFVDFFPTTVTGKIQKFAMRDIMREKLSLKAEKTA